MAYSIKHKFQTGKADGSDTTLVKPSNWNDEHDFEMADGTILGRPVGSGDGPAQEIPLSAIYMTGMIVMWGGVAAPTGWLLCQGQSLLRTAYPALFTAIGTAFGSANSAHFTLPDMRGRVVAGVDGTGRLTGATMTNPHLLGGTGGQEQEQAYADVNVSVNVDVGVTVSGSLGGSTSTESADVSGLQFGGSGVAAETHTHSVSVSGAMSGSGGGSGSGSGGGYTRAVTNVQPTLTVNFMIKT